jgi:hypothetical protein
MKRRAQVSGKSKAIVQLRDGFSGEAINGASVTFRLDEGACEPLRKGGGFYVFFNLSDTASHALSITCRGFFDAHIALSVISLPLAKPLAEVVTVCDLEPSALYAYPPGTAIVRGHVTSGGKPLAGAEIFACCADRLGAWHWRKTRSSDYPRDRASPDGNYALALPRAAANGEVMLRFAKDGHALSFDRTTPARSLTTTVNVDLQPEIA